MKRLFTIIIVLAGAIQFQAIAQENHGGTLNLGLGLGGYSGYYKYVGRSFPVVHIDYEFNAGKNFTLAPFANFYTYSNNYYWNTDYYTYRETVIPIGVKGTFYLDNLLHASSEWDFYAAGSLGFAVVNRRWENGYAGDKNYYRGGNALFLDAHIGVEYHFNNRVGLFLDLSSGVSTIGLALH
jgi:hypothetical protein